MNNFEMLSAMADNALDANERIAVEQLLRDDPAAQSRYESILHLKRTISDKLPIHDSPATLKLCKARIAELDRAKRTETIVGKYSYAMAGILALSIVSAAYLQRIGGPSTMDKATLQRTLSAGVAGGSNVASSGGAGDWVRNQLGKPPEAILGGLTLWRVDRLTIDGRLMGRLIYTDGASDFVLVVVPDLEECEGAPIQGYPGMRYSRVGQMNAVTWCDPSATYVFAADKPLEVLLGHLKK
ncbi:MAG: anti-sigma factor family protein [Fimbriimonadales bacterium]